MQSRGMLHNRELMSARGDEKFRKGACHGARWFLETSRTLAAQGHSAAEIVEYLAELADVLADWRAQTEEMPDGNPWDWSFKDLASVIQRHKEQ